MCDLQAQQLPATCQLLSTDHSSILLAELKFSSVTKAYLDKCPEANVHDRMAAGAICLSRSLLADTVGHYSLGEAAKLL